MKFELNATTRTLRGTGASRRLRRAAKVPGIVYGATSPPVAIELDHNPLFLALKKEAFHSSLIVLKVDEKEETVLLRDVQPHPYKPLVLHVDFQRVAADKLLHQKVPLHFINGDIAPGVKLVGGTISHIMNEIDIACLPGDLPEFIEVDLKDLQSGHSVHVSELKLPKGVIIIQHGTGDRAVATILTKRGSSSGGTGEEVVAAEAS